MEAKKQKITKLTVAVVGPTSGPAFDTLPQDKADFIVANDLETFTSSSKLDQVDCLVFVAAGGDKALLEPLTKLLPNLKWVHSFFAGVDALADFIKARLIGTSIPLTNGRGAFSDSLAEWVATSVLHFNKQIPRVIKNRQDKKWEKFTMDTVKGKTLGIVGFGDIGQCTAKLMKSAFGMKVLAVRNNPNKTSEHADEIVGPDRKLEVFARSDFVVCALPGTKETLNYCSTAEFKAMKETAVFISIGRGLAVDEDALAHALQTNSILGAAVDVFKVEPLPQDSPLWTCENALITSHNADFTEDYLRLGWSVFVENLNKFQDGCDVLATPVDKSAGY
eukprot:m.191897 g.191897  ORF g.191897 m.191897 type:complete len:335 (-) comp32447_c1_seq1:186-1190(-)